MEKMNSNQDSRTINNIINKKKQDIISKLIKDSVSGA